MRILSWNIQYGQGCDGRVDLARIAGHIGAWGDPDVICLQEVSVGFEGATQRADQVAQLSGLFPGYRLFAPPALHWFDAGRERRFGNAILTRLPVADVLSHALPRPADDRFAHMQRQLLEVTVLASAGPLRVATTHLEYYSKRQRAAQVQRIRELEEQWAAAIQAQPPDKGGSFARRPAPVGTVLCGDFNFPTQEDSYALLQTPLATPRTALQGPRLIDAWQLAGGGAAHLPTCGVFDRGQWPQGPHARDFFFVSEALSARVASLTTDVTTDLSDHQPLLLSLID